MWWNFPDSVEEGNGEVPMTQYWGIRPVLLGAFTTFCIFYLLGAFYHIFHVEAVQGFEMYWDQSMEVDGI